MNDQQINDQAFAANIRRALDESTERLPYRVSQRLAAARLAAVAAAAPAAAGQTVRAGSTATSISGSRGGSLLATYKTRLIPKNNRRFEDAVRAPAHDA